MPVPTTKDHLARLAEIGQERTSLIDRLQALETEQTAIVKELAQETPAPQPPVPSASPVEAETNGKPRRRKGVVPLPVGSPIKRRELDVLKAQILAMDPGSFQTTGRDFIRQWYPKLANTPHWHELSTALQKHFTATRQQVAGFAARIARATGEAHVNAQAH